MEMKTELLLMVFHVYIIPNSIAFNKWNFWEDPLLPSDCADGSHVCFPGTKSHCILKDNDDTTVAYVQDCIPTVIVEPYHCLAYERFKERQYNIVQRKCKDSLECPQTSYISIKSYLYNCTKDNTLNEYRQFDHQRKIGLSTAEISAYNRNAKVFASLQNKDDVAGYYDNWVEQYENDLSPDRYNGPVIAADLVERYFYGNKDDTTILDVAAGTGFVGEELKRRDFRNIDALDPSEKMLEKAMTKNIYRRYIYEFLTDEKLPITENSYDFVVSSGGFGNGHIPCEALHELIRITKQGGLVITVMREEYLEVDMYKNKLEHLMIELQRKRKWKRVERQIVQNYFYDKTGVVFVYKVMV